jgi:CBS domain-containing protein
MNAADVMTNDVLTLNAETSVLDAARLMLQHRVSGLPVLDWQGRLVGVLTEGDLLRRIETGTERRRSHWLEMLLGPGRAAQDYIHAHARKVGEAMSNTVIHVAPDATLEQIVGLMEKHHVKRLPVVAGNKMVGIVSRADLLRALVATADKAAATPVSDEDIRANILAELDRQRWAPRAVLEVEVKRGIVELRGTITDDRERLALRIACENIAGVKGVTDHLVFVEPLSGMAIDPPDERR